MSIRILRRAGLILGPDAPHDPLFQEEAPNNILWISPHGLPWICIQVQPMRENTGMIWPAAPSIWVWFQIRTGSEYTMLHPSTIRALHLPDRIQFTSFTQTLNIDNMLDIRIAHNRVLDIIDISQGNTTHPGAGNQFWNTQHNMLGMDAMTVSPRDEMDTERRHEEEGKDDDTSDGDDKSQPSMTHHRHLSYSSR